MTTCWSLRKVTFSQYFGAIGQPHIAYYTKTGNGRAHRVYLSISNKTLWSILNNSKACSKLRIAVFDYFFTSEGKDEHLADRKQMKSNSKENFLREPLSAL